MNVYACTIGCIPALHVKKVYVCDTPIRLTPALHVKKVVMYLQDVLLHYM